MSNQGEGYKDYSKYLRHYPNKSQAMKEYRKDAGVGLFEAIDVMDIVFARYEATGEKVQRPPKFTQKNEENSNHTVAKTGCCLFAIFYILFGPIFKLTKKYY